MPSPTAGPTTHPTEQPSPTMGPTTKPTDQPSPTEAPTTKPTEQPSPTEAPTTKPIDQPSPTMGPTTHPTDQPSPTMGPSMKPTKPSPTMDPTKKKLETLPPTTNKPTMKPIVSQKQAEATKKLERPEEDYMLIGPGVCQNEIGDSPPNYSGELTEPKCKEFCELVVMNCIGYSYLKSKTRCAIWIDSMEILDSWRGKQYGMFVNGSGGRIWKTGDTLVKSSQDPGWLCYARVHIPPHDIMPKGELNLLATEKPEATTPPDPYVVLLEELSKPMQYRENVLSFLDPKNMDVPDFNVPYKADEEFDPKEALTDKELEGSMPKYEGEREVSILDDR
eukprot:UN29741